MDIHFDLRWYLGQAQSEEVEPQLFRLLQAIEQGGSIRIAAEHCAVSYRYAWGLMQKWQRLLGGPLVILERGRGAKLTPLGEKLLWAKRRITARLTPQFESLASELGVELRAALMRETQPPPLRIYASHGLAIPLLRDRLNAQAISSRVDLQFRGSLESLRLFAASKCDLAGFHLPEGPLGLRLAPHYRRWLDPEAHVLIHVVQRWQGLMMAAGNPEGIESISDLAEKRVRFVNRQLSSGTRLIFDHLLEQAGIAVDQIQGYTTEEFTHLAVAAIVASGAADAGFGIEAAAHRFGLHFMPMVRENYWFALNREALNLPAVADLLRLLRSPEFHDPVAALPGYDPRAAGTVISVEHWMNEGLSSR
jgi:putative molybdopterin biosynthesis protein